MCTNLKKIQGFARRQYRTHKRHFANYYSVEDFVQDCIVEYLKAKKLYRHDNFNSSFLYKLVHGIYYHRTIRMNKEVAGLASYYLVINNRGDNWENITNNIITLIKIEKKLDKDRQELLDTVFFYQGDLREAWENSDKEIQRSGFIRRYYRLFEYMRSMD